MLSVLTGPLESRGVFEADTISLSAAISDSDKGRERPSGPFKSQVVVGAGTISPNAAVSESNKGQEWPSDPLKSQVAVQADAISSNAAISTISACSKGGQEWQQAVRMLEQSVTRCSNSMYMSHT